MLPFERCKLAQHAVALDEATGPRAKAHLPSNLIYARIRARVFPLNTVTQQLVEPVGLEPTPPRPTIYASSCLLRNWTDEANIDVL
jgi:hypothetical protein